MIQLLISVRNAAEANLAKSHGAHIVDIKEPLRGSLGRADDTVIREVVAVCDDVPVSVAMGELCDAPANDGSSVTLPGSLFSGVDYAKIGCRQCSRDELHRRWSRWCASLPGHVKRVAVAYADAERAQAPDVEAVLAMGIAAAADAFLIDTYEKTGQNVFDFISLDRLAVLIRHARSAGLRMALAGGLRLTDLATAVSLQPDVIAVRGAACDDGRGGNLSADKIVGLTREIEKLSNENMFLENGHARC